MHFKSLTSGFQLCGSNLTTACRSGHLQIMPTPGVKGRGMGNEERGVGNGNIGICHSLTPTFRLSVPFSGPPYQQLTKVYQNLHDNQNIHLLPVLLPTSSQILPHEPSVQGSIFRPPKLVLPLTSGFDFNPLKTVQLSECGCERERRQCSLPLTLSHPHHIL